MRQIYVNEAFDKAINDYISSKEKKESVLYNSFLVVIIRMLINIYGELDIINPFLIKDEHTLDINLMKFGAKAELISKLKQDMESYYKLELDNLKRIKREINPYFVGVQKTIIDLYNVKRLNYGVTEDEVKTFFDLLYTPGTSNALRQSYNYLCAENIYEIAEYYQVTQKKRPKVEEKDNKNIIGFDVYEVFNYSIADISKMNNEEIDQLNSNIYKSLDINENGINKDYLLKEKIHEIKMQNTPMMTGNGYVDILLIMSIIITVVMVIVIFVTLVF